MSCPNPTDRGLPDPSCLADADRQVESVVLAFLIEQHPVQLTIPEVSLALNKGLTDFGREDAVERAIYELVGAGLLRCHGGSILPTRAALYGAHLEAA